MIAATMDLYVACDGEELLCELYDGNDCDLTGADACVDFGAFTMAGIKASIQAHVLDLQRRAGREGWRPVYTPADLAVPLYLCPRCARVFDRVGPDVRENMRKRFAARLAEEGTAFVVDTDAPVDVAPAPTPEWGSIGDMRRAILKAWPDDEGSP